MASVIMHTYNQIKSTGGMKLFRSHKEEIKDGDQARDFIYIKDVVKCIYHLSKRNQSGLYNIGTGEARTFMDLAKGVFDALNLESNIDFIDTPIDIREKYQYYTQANIQKIRKVAGYNDRFYTLEEGINEYVKDYLANGANYSFS